MRAAHATTPLPQGVSIARVRLAEMANDVSLARLLTPGELARLETMDRPGRRREYLTSRALVKLLFLDRCAFQSERDLQPVLQDVQLDVADDEEIAARCREVEVVRDNEGTSRAPRLRWRGVDCRSLHVSITHAAGWTGVALSTAGPVGVDLAVVGERLPSFYRAHFSARERDWVARGGDASSQALHTLLWTLKESVVKTGVAPGATLWGYDEIEVLVDSSPRHVAACCETLGNGELTPLMVRVPVATMAGAQRAWFTRTGEALFSLVTLETLTA